MALRQGSRGTDHQGEEYSQVEDDRIPSRIRDLDLSRHHDPNDVDNCPGQGHTFEREAPDDTLSKRRKKPQTKQRNKSRSIGGVAVRHTLGATASGAVDPTAANSRSVTSNVPMASDINDNLDDSGVVDADLLEIIEEVHTIEQRFEQALQYHRDGFAKIIDFTLNCIAKDYSASLDHIRNGVPNLQRSRSKSEAAQKSLQECQVGIPGAH